MEEIMSRNTGGDGREKPWRQFGMEMGLQHPLMALVAIPVLSPSPTSHGKRQLLPEFQSKIPPGRWKAVQEQI